MAKESIRSSEFELLLEKLTAQTTLINAQFTGVNERLDKINGKVGKHDEQINEALTERAKNRQEQKDNFHKLDEVIKKVDELKEIESHHITTCPQADKVRELQDAVMIQKDRDSNKSIIFGRTAQIIIIFIMFSGLITSIGLGLANLNKKSTIQYPSIDETSRMRGFPLDSVYWNDSLNTAPTYKY
jgi:hypothetical protein